MSLESGQIIQDDISPNAGILGTQIADKTLSLRNLSDDTFGIVASGIHVLTRSANTNTQVDTVAHGLSFIPTIIFNVEQTTTQPGVWYSGAQNVRINYTTGAIGEMPIVTVDATNIIFSTIAPTNNGEYSSSKVFTFKYYLLQETAN